MEANRRVIAGILGQLADRVSVLREYQAAPDPPAERGLRYLGAERTLEIAATCCFDAGNHLIARLSLGRARTYADIGPVLRSAGVISANTEQFMDGLADLRNRLAHLYWRVTPEEVEQAIPRLIPQFEKFAQELQQFLESRR